MRKMVGSVMISDVVAKSSTTQSSKVATVEVKSRHSAVTPERVSQIFGCGLETAKEMIRVTTQAGVRHAVHPLRR